MFSAETFIERNSTVVSVIATATIGIVGWWIAWYWREKDRETKTFDYRVIDDIPILLGGDRPEKLKVIYGAREVNNPVITQVRFKNTGKHVIDAMDFLGQPYEIVRPGAELLDYSVVDQSARDLVGDLAEVIHSGKNARHTLSVLPKTLNPGDWFTVQLVYDGGPSVDRPAVTGRIRGQTRESAIYPTTNELRAAREWLPIGGMLAATLLLIGVYGIATAPQDNRPFILIAAGIIVMAITLIGWVRQRRRLFGRRLQ